jgi:hypothetical protein
LRLGQVIAFERFTKIRDGRGSRQDQAEGEEPMRAAVATAFDQPLQVKEVPLPEPGPTQVLFETRTLDDINASLDDVLAGRVPARLVLLP